MDTANAIAHSEDATVRLVTVVSPDASATERTEAEQLLEESTDRFDVNVERDLLTGADVADALVREADNHDLALIGATREGLLQEFVFGSIPAEVGRRTETTVIMTKKNLGITSRLRRLLTRR